MLTTRASPVPAMTSAPSPPVSSAAARGVGRPPRTSGQTGTSRYRRASSSTTARGDPRPSWLQATPRRQAEITSGGLSRSSIVPTLGTEDFRDLGLDGPDLGRTAPAALAATELAVE